MTILILIISHALVGLVGALTTLGFILMGRDTPEI